MTLITVWIWSWNQIYPRNGQKVLAAKKLIFLTNKNNELSAHRLFSATLQLCLNPKKHIPPQSILHEGKDSSSLKRVKVHPANANINHPASRGRVRGEADLWPGLIPSSRGQQLLASRVEIPEEGKFSCSAEKDRALGLLQVLWSWLCFLRFFLHLFS